MDEVKNWYRSRTVWGGAVALAAAIAGLFGYALDTAETAALTGAVADAAAAIGAVVAILGRIDAKQRLR